MAIGPTDLKEIDVPKPALGTVSTVIHGRTFEPQQQILLYDPSEWERFIQEWVQSQMTVYHKVRRFAGAGDMGIDIAGFTDSDLFNGVWDNFQCKHYENSLVPSDITVEIGKILWYCFTKEFKPPRKHYFIAPRGCGVTLTKLLMDSAKLKEHVRTNWGNHCREKITSKTKIDLDGEFLAYFESFDFSMFDTKTSLDIIKSHRETEYYAIRFGGGLKERPPAPSPPSSILTNEIRYTQQLFEAYSEANGVNIKTEKELDSIDLEFKNHFNRQRESFYHAEALRIFARDNVPSGTFENLQDEIFFGVCDVCNDSHNNAYSRVIAVCQAALRIQLTSNSLIVVLNVKDRQGICHQLANINKLTWKR